MVQLQILSGKMAGDQWLARHFPFWMGRLPSCELCVDEPGVWDRHFQISFQPEGFVLATSSNAFVALNARQIQQAVLKNGDLIEIGLLKLRFSLAPARQMPLVTREAVVLTVLTLLAIFQIAIILSLFR